MDVLGGGMQDVVVQHGVRGRSACRERGVRRRGSGRSRRMLVLLHGGVRVHMLRRGGGELGRCMPDDVRGRGEVALCGGVRRR